ncbi:hypothetical protein BLA29_010775, partial [Euroglyphus maynei]
MYDRSCNIYLIAPVDKIITITFKQKNGNFECDNNHDNYIDSLDGWNYYGHSYPATNDPNFNFKTRKQSFCQPGTVRAFSFNAGMIQYRFKFGGGFTFKVEFHENKYPCTIFIQGSENIDGKIRLDLNAIHTRDCTIYIVQTRYTKGRFIGLSLEITSMNIG